jgi:hypothetical protein
VIDFPAALRQFPGVWDAQPMGRATNMRGRMESRRAMCDLITPVRTS